MEIEEGDINLYVKDTKGGKVHIFWRGTIFNQRLWRYIEMKLSKWHKNSHALRMESVVSCFFTNPTSGTELSSSQRKEF